MHPLENETHNISSNLARYELLETFIKNQGLVGSLVLCAKDMSHRQYFRLNAGNQSFIIMDAPPPETPDRFIVLSEYLIQHGLTSPHILAFDAENGFVLLDDFGDRTFTRILETDFKTEASLYKTAIAVLKKLHYAPRPFFIEDYTKQKLLNEVEVFIDWYWPYVKSNKAPEIIKKDFISLWENLFDKMPETPKTIVLRDFHCDNLMAIQDADPHSLSIKTCGILDFQDALWGSVAYDYISLVEDARRDVSPAIIKVCEQKFFADYSDDQVKNIQLAGKILAAGRHIKVLGVFARYAIRANNPSKCVHNPRLWRYLEQLFIDPIFDDLSKWLSINFSTPSVRI